MSLWFVSAAILPEITAEAGLSPAGQAALSSGVQVGFVIGALTLAILGVADRYDPRRVIAVSALIGAGPTWRSWSFPWTGRWRWGCGWPPGSAWPGFIRSA